MLECVTRESQCSLVAVVAIEVNALEVAGGSVMVKVEIVKICSKE